MNWLDLIAYFFGGAFLTNAIPHIVAGSMGEPFQSPFATPRGEGLSTSTVNILWGFFNLAVGYRARLPRRRFRTARYRRRRRALPRRPLDRPVPGAPLRTLSRRQRTPANMIRTFRSLENHNYRIWAAGALVSNIGTWMQRAAQDWLVLTQLTDRSASAVGIVMALQFGPQLLLMPWSGLAADYFNQRKLLMATQATMGALSLILGLLTVTGLRPALARLCLRLPVRLHRRPRRAGAPDLRLRTGPRHRSVERDRAELHLLQRRAHDRPRGGRPAHRRASAPAGRSCSTARRTWRC